MARLLTTPNPGAPRRAFSLARPQRVTKDDLPRSLVTFFQGVAWLGLQLRTSNEDHPTSYTSLKVSGQGCPLLRASDEHILIVRVLRARRAPGRFLPRWRTFSASC